MYFLISKHKETPGMLQNINKEVKFLLQFRMMGRERRQFKLKIALVLRALVYSFTRLLVYSSFNTIFAVINN
jgi:hypothetical protein